MLRRRRESLARWNALDGQFWDEVVAIEKAADAELADRDRPEDELTIYWETAHPNLSRWTYGFQKGDDGLYWPEATITQERHGRRIKTVFTRQQNSEATVVTYDTQLPIDLMECGELALEMYTQHLKEFRQALGGKTCERFVQLEPSIASQQNDWEESV